MDARASTAVIGLLFGAAACGADAAPLSIRLHTPAFATGSAMPVTYTCEAANHSPPFSWDKLPGTAQSLVFIMEDLSAKGYAHWVVYNIPPGEVGAAEAYAPRGSTVGTNDAGKPGYTGPCPPSSVPHRYAFTVYALDTTLDLPEGATKAQVTTAMAGHIMARGQIIGTYGKS